MVRWAECPVVVLVLPRPGLHPGARVCNGWLMPLLHGETAVPCRQRLGAGVVLRLETGSAPGAEPAFACFTSASLPGRPPVRPASGMLMLSISGRGNGRSARAGPVSAGQRQSPPRAILVSLRNEVFARCVLEFGTVREVLVSPEFSPFADCRCVWPRSSKTQANSES